MKEKSKGLLGVIIVAIVLIVGYFALSGGTETTDTTNTTVGEGDTITIGFIGSLSGEVAFIGESVRAGVEFAVDEVNAAGGVNGAMIEVIYEDGGCDATMAANAANKLVNVDGVTAIIGATCSPATLAAAPIVEEAGIPMISYSSTAPAVSDAGEYIYRTVPSDSFQAVFAADYIYNTLGYENVAVMYCLNDWCDGNHLAFVDAFEGTIVAEEAHEEGATDLRAQVTKVAEAAPDAVYMPAFPADTVAGIRQLAEQGLGDTPLFGADAWGELTIWEDLGELGEGAMYTEPSNADAPESYSEGILNYIEEDTVTVYTARAYDAVLVLVEALTTAESLAGADIKTALDAVEGLEGVADTYTFDEMGDPTNAAYVVKQIVDGESVIVE